MSAPHIISHTGLDYNPCSTMSSSPSSTAGQSPGLKTQLNQFWQRVTDGLELNQLWTQFHTEARASYRLYERDYGARARQETQPRGVFHTVLEFLWAILEKLSPARRVLLLFGILFLILPGAGFSHAGKSGEVEVVEVSFHFWAGVLFFIVLMLEVSDRVVMKRDLEIARDIQSWLLPSTPPSVPGMTIAFATRPANTVAGDYYDVFARPGTAPDETRFLLAVADVAGKSIPAALLMATFQASLKTLSAIPCSLAELVRGMNQYACNNSQGGLRFTTAFLAEFDPVSQTLTYINAGHNTPILRRSAGTLERLTIGGLPLGILAGANYESGSLVLQKDDWLAIYTDGVVEAMNQRDEEYGEQRLVRVLDLGAAATPAEMLRRVISDVDAFVGATPQHDDITCLLVKVG